MALQHIPYYKTRRFSKLICDYLAQDEKLSAFYGYFPSVGNLSEQAKLKCKSFSSEARKLLVSEIKRQYQTIALHSAVSKNIEQLGEKKTVTITTGHQPCLMTGPVFFVYKILTTIKLCVELAERHHDCNFVPIYWMATEDHDFEEVSSFLFQDKKIRWNKESKGPVGDLALGDLQKVLDVFEQHLGNSRAAEALKEIIRISYRKARNLADATRMLVNALFESYGLVIVDGNSAVLKKQFIPFVKNDLLKQHCFQHVTAQINELQAHYDLSFKPQVNPREINLFYLKKEGRFRIEKNGKNFRLDGIDKVFSKQELLFELEKYPERFSPNALMRPLYQEVILPNICYVGGGGELAYWLELKSFFESQKVLFPTLLLRNSVLLMNAKTTKKVAKLNFSIEDLFLKRNEVINKKIKQISDIDLNLTPLKKRLKEQFVYLEKLISATDASFEGAVKAQKAKQFKGIDTLEKRLLSAQKRKLQDQVKRMSILQETLFPSGALQERQLNFATFYMDMGASFIPTLMAQLSPLNHNFTILEY